MLSRFGAYIITHTPNRYRPTLRSLRALLQPFLTLLSKMDQTQSITSDSDPPPLPPPFNPREPAIPISYPLKTLEELESRSYFESFHFPFNKSKLTLQSATSNNDFPQRPRILVCHDMQGGYVDDKWIQGGNNPDAYAIWHWYLIDVFVYFSHYLVTLPPPNWTNTAHKHGVKVLFLIAISFSLLVFTFFVSFYLPFYLRIEFLTGLPFFFPLKFVGVIGEMISLFLFYE